MEKEFKLPLRPKNQNRHGDSSDADDDDDDFGKYRGRRYWLEIVVVKFRFCGYLQ